MSHSRLARAFALLITAQPRTLRNATAKFTVPARRLGEQG